jgi:hypothetical protein
MLFKNYVSRVAVIVVGAALCGPVGAQSVMQPGGWQMKVKITAQNPTTGESKTINESTSKMCLSKEFLAKDPYLSPSVDKEKMEKKNARCSISDEKRADNSASWKMKCAMADGSSVDMLTKNVASAQKLTSDIQQTIRKGGETVFAKMAMDSSFIGECTNDMPKP